MAAKPPNLAAELAQRMRELRNERGWSQAELADEMTALGFGWSRMTVTEVEGSRQRAVTIEELLGLAQVFDVGVKRLLGATYRHPPTSPQANMIQVTPEWRIDRRDTASLLDSGRRTSAQRAQIESQLAGAQALLAGLDEIVHDTELRQEEVRGEIAALEAMLNNEEGK